MKLDAIYQLTMHASHSWFWWYVRGNKSKEKSKEKREEENKIENKMIFKMSNIFFLIVI